MGQTFPASQEAGYNSGAAAGYTFPSMIPELRNAFNRAFTPES